MALVSTYFDGQIKIRISGAPKSQPRVKFSQTWSKLTKITE